jgi:hypothetical protein
MRLAFVLSIIVEEIKVLLDKEVTILPTGYFYANHQ